MKWYARTDHILWMGPYDTMEQAMRATIGRDGVPVSGAFVWPADRTPTARPKHEERR